MMESSLFSILSYLLDLRNNQKLEKTTFQEIIREIREKVELTIMEMFTGLNLILNRIIHMKLKNKTSSLDLEIKNYSKLTFTMMICQMKCNRNSKIKEMWLGLQNNLNFNKENYPILIATMSIFLTNPLNSILKCLEAIHHHLSLFL